MADKNDCVSVDEAAAQARVSKATLYNYINVLGIQMIKFPFDRKAYVVKSDLNTVKEFIERNRG